MEAVVEEQAQQKPVEGSRNSSFRSVRNTSSRVIVVTPSDPDAHVSVPLAARSPKSVLELMGIKANASQSSSGTPSSSVNTSGLNPPSDTFIKRNTKPFSVGATSQEVVEEMNNARKLVEELHNSGKSIADLTNPKTYFKHFG